MNNCEVYIHLGKIFNHQIKLSLSVIKNKRDFNLSDNYILESVRGLGFNTLNKIKKSKEEVAVLDPDKDCMLTFKFIENFLALELICPTEYVNMNQIKKRG